MANQCKRCGMENGDQAKFCTNCGQDLSQPVYYYQAPAQNRAEVMSIGRYLLTFLLLSIPVANIVMMIIWSVSESTNKNLQNMSRALWIWAAICIGVSVVFSVILLQVSSSLFFYSWDVPLWNDSPGWDMPMMEAPWFDTLNSI